MPSKDPVRSAPHGTGDTMDCPYCDWSMEHDPADSAATLAAEVDAEIHFENEHPETKLPPGYKFGDYQCPQCYRMDGLEGSVSCSHCGHIPEEARA